MSEQQERKRPREKVSDGIRQGIGVLSAFKDALEETIQEARDRGDLSTDRAKEVMKTALQRAQTAAGSARERFDFVTQGELESLEAQLAELRARVERLEQSGPSPGASAQGEQGGTPSS